MRLSFFILLYLYFYTSAFCQLTISAEKLDFGDVETGKQGILNVDIRNSGTEGINITQIQSLHPDFKSDNTGFYLNPGQSRPLNVEFSPKQNIRYNSELIVICDLSPLSYRIDLQGNGRLPNAYYASTFNLWNEDLKAELKRIISRNYNSLGYTSARDAMYSDIDNKNGWVSCAYTGRTAQFNSRSGANSNQFNCEHTWPQSMFSQNEPERSDIHHLFPTDVTANNKRSNYPFGEVNTNPSWTEGGSRLANQTFEPRDEQKGATARAMFYFVTRYTNYSGFLNDQEEVLRNWHRQFGPQDWEKSRNEAIYQLQNNRNPFCDFPGFVDRIPSFSKTVPLLKEAVLELSHRQLLIPADNRMYRIAISNSGNETAIINWSKNQNDELEILTASQFELQAGESVLFEMRMPENASNINTEIVFNYGHSRSETLRVKTAGLNRIETSEQKIQQKYRWHASSSSLYLLAGQETYDSAMIYDVNGRQWFLTEFKSALNEWDLSSLPAGIYFVCEILNGHKSCFRILKH